MIKSIISVLFVTLSLIQVQARNKKQDKPNVLLIYTDDHRYSGVHALGGQAVLTPNIDALATSGIAFTNTYLMGSFNAGTCVPSRAMLNSGRQLFNLSGIGRTIPKAHQTIGETFKKEGYQTHMIGKWHNDNGSLARSFEDGGPVMGRGVYLTDHFRMPLCDWNKDGTYKKEDNYLITYDDNGKQVRRAITKQDKKGPFGTEEDGPHTSEIFADNAVTFFKNNDQKKPFYMYLAFHAPHDPRHAPKKFEDMYPPESISLVPSYLPQHPFDNGAMQTRDEALDVWPRTADIAKKQLASYYAIITHLDAQIGKVIAALKASGQYENTLIILAGDSGLGVGCHGLLGKQNIYDEDGIHVPFIVSGGMAPKRGKRIDALSYIHDIYPTICDIAGLEIPESVNGKSMLPIINGHKKQVRDYTYHAYRQHMRAYRKGDFKLIEYVRAPDIVRATGEVFIAGSRMTQLFNIKTDPWESTDLAFRAEYKETLEAMRTEMKAKAKELGDKKENVDQAYDFWDYYKN